VRHHRDSTHRHQHQADGQQPDRARVSPEILVRRAKRGRIDPGRQEHE
jgi:hypothetical protein